MEVGLGLRSCWHIKTPTPPIYIAHHDPGRTDTASGVDSGGERFDVDDSDRRRRRQRGAREGAGVVGGADGRPRSSQATEVQRGS